MTTGLRSYATRPSVIATTPTGNEPAIYTLGDWDRLRRFLILGSEAAKYSASGLNTNALVADNAKAVVRCIDSDGIRVVNEIVTVSQEGLAPNNDPALFALALAAATGDEDTRRAALAALPKVARTGTHLMHFGDFVQKHRGWGRGLRKGVANWFITKSASDLAYQAVKYQGRDGWTLRDMLRLSHPHAPSEAHNIVYHWMTQGWENVGIEPHDNDALRLVWAFETLKAKANRGELTAQEAARFIRDYRMPREAIPTQMLNERVVWEALLEDMPMTALIRNLATMTRVGIIGPLSDGTKKVVETLGNVDRIRKARVHPMALLVALKVYAQGHGERGNNTWTPNQKVCDALDAAFYTAFKNIEPSGKKHLLALDVSGSMESRGTVAGIQCMTAREICAAMALVTANTEPETFVVGFSSGRTSRYYDYFGRGRGDRGAVTANAALITDGICPIDISPSMRLDAVIEKMSGLDFGTTDCGLPMKWAKRHNIPVDVFAVYTDSEHNTGRSPMTALKEYRATRNAGARLIAIGTQSTDFTIGDPSDAGILNVAGFDASAPAVMANFAAGRI